LIFFHDDPRPVFVFLHHKIAFGPFGHEHKQAHTLRLSHFKSRAIVFFFHQVAVYFG
jgi:hypothetical protein